MKSGSFTFLGHAIFTPDLEGFCTPDPDQARKDKSRTTVDNHLPDDHLLRYTVSDYLSTTNGFLVGSHNACMATLYLSHGRAMLTSSYTSNEDSSSNKEENPGRVYATLTNRDNTRDSLYLEEQCVYNSMAFNFFSQYLEKWHQLCPTKDANTSFRFIYEIEKQPSLSQKKATGLLEQIKNNILKQLTPSPYVLSGAILDKLFELTGSTNWREHKRNPSSRLSAQVENYLNDIFHQPSQEEEKTEEGKEETKVAIQASALYFENILKNLVFIKPQESDIDNATNHHYRYHHTLALMAHAIDQYLEEQNNSNKEKREFNANKAGILGDPGQQALFFCDLETLLASAKESNRANFLAKIFSTWISALDNIIASKDIAASTPQEIDIPVLMKKIHQALNSNPARTLNSIISSIILELTVDFCSECEQLGIKLVAARPVSQTIDAGLKILVHQPELLQEIDASYFLYRFYLAYIAKQVDLLAAALAKQSSSPSKTHKQKTSIFEIEENKVCLLNDLTDFLSRPNHEFDQTIISNAKKAGWISGIKSMLDSPNSFDSVLVKQVIKQLGRNYTKAHTDFRAMCDIELPEYRKKLLFNALKTELLGFIDNWKNTVTKYIQNLPGQTIKNKQDSIQSINDFFANYKTLLTTENKPKVENSITELTNFISNKLKQINPAKKKLAIKLFDQHNAEDPFQQQLVNNLELLQNLLDKFGKTNMAVAYLIPAHNDSISAKTQSLWEEILLTSNSMQADIDKRLAVATQLLAMQPSHLPELSRKNYLHIRAIQTIEALQNSLATQNISILNSQDTQILKLIASLDIPENRAYIKHIPTLLVALQRRYATKPTSLEKKFSIAFASLYIKHQASTHKTQSHYLTAFESYALASVTGDHFACLNYASITYLKFAINQQGLEPKTIGYLCILYQFIYALPPRNQTNLPPAPSEIFNVFSSNQYSIFSENGTLQLISRLLSGNKQHECFKICNNVLKQEYARFTESFSITDVEPIITKKDIADQITATEIYLADIGTSNTDEITYIMTAFVYLQLLAYAPFIIQPDHTQQIAAKALGALDKLKTSYNSTDPTLGQAYQRLHEDLDYYYENLIAISGEKKVSQIAITQELKQRTKQNTSTGLDVEHDITKASAPFASWAKEQLNDLIADTNHSKPIIFVVLMYLLRQTLAPLYTEQYCSSKSDDITDLMKVFAKLCFMHKPPLNQEGDQINQASRSRIKSRRVGHFDQTTLDDQYGKTLDTAFIDTIKSLSTVDMSAAIRYLRTLADYVELSDHGETTLNYSTAFSDIAEVILPNIPFIPNNDITIAINSAKNSLLFFLILFEAMLTPSDSNAGEIVLYRSHIEAALQVFDKPEEVMQELNTKGGEEESKESPKENIRRKKGKNVAALHKLVTKGHSEHDEKPGYFYSFIQQKNRQNNSTSPEVIAAREFIHSAKQISKVFMNYLERLLSHFPKDGATASSDCKTVSFPVNDPRYQLTGSMLTVLYSAYHRINPVIANKLLAPKLMEQHHIEATPYTAEMVTQIPRKNFLKKPAEGLEGTINNFFEGTDNENKLLLNKHAAIFHVEANDHVYIHINGNSTTLTIEEIFDWLHHGLRFFAYNTQLTDKETKITIAVEKIETIGEISVNNTEVKSFTIKQHDIVEQAPECAPDFLTAWSHTKQIYITAMNANYDEAIDVANAKIQQTSYSTEEDSNLKKSAYTVERVAAATKIRGTYLITKQDERLSAYELFRLNRSSAENGLMHRCYNALFETVELLIKKQQPEANYPEHKNPGEFLLRCITLAYITKLANLEPKIRPFGRENYYTDASHFVHPPAFRAIKAAHEHICSLLFYCYVAHAFFDELASLEVKDNKLLVFKLNLIRMINRPTEILENVHEWASSFFDQNDRCYATYLPKKTQARLKDTKDIISQEFPDYAAPKKEKKTLEVLSFFFFPQATSVLIKDNLYQPVATNSANKETPVENFSVTVVGITC